MIPRFEQLSVFHSLPSLTLRPQLIYLQAYASAETLNRFEGPNCSERAASCVLGLFFGKKQQQKRIGDSSSIGFVINGQPWHMTRIFFVRLFAEVKLS